MVSFKFRVRLGLRLQLRLAVVTSAVVELCQ